MVNEHDMTKRMMETVRSGKHLIREFVGAPDLDVGTEEPKNQVIGDTGEDNNTDNVGTEDNDVIELSSAERKSEESKFRSTIDNSTKFNVFNVYPKANNVVFGGEIQGMGGLEFQFTLEDTNGFYITANNLQITDEVARNISKMKGYYDTFRDEWFEKLAKEYKPGR